MNEDTQNEGADRRQRSMIGAGIAIGVGFGVALGLSFDNLALGIAIGAAFGVAIGAALESRNQVTPGGDRPPGASPRPSGRVLLTLLVGVGLVVLSVVLTLSFGGG